jgi:hypothetical protein
MHLTQVFENTQIHWLKYTPMHLTQFFFLNTQIHWLKYTPMHLTQVFENTLNLVDYLFYFFNK